MKTFSICSALSHSLPATIPNLEENKVKIQVPGLQQAPLQQQQLAATRTHSAVAKQTSLDKGCYHFIFDCLTF
jgi:hypothetical protein